jgi:hypothetical protein
MMRLAILTHYVRDSLAQLNKDLLSIKLEGKEKVAKPFPPHCVLDGCWLN